MSLKCEKAVKSVRIPFNVTPDMKEMIRQKASKYAQGNVTLFLTEAALNFVPKKGGKRK